MANRTPNLQTRSQYNPYWGVYANSSTALPNQSGNTLSGGIFTKLEVGDTAFVTGDSLWVCTNVGTDGGGDAVWESLGGGGGGSQSLDDVINLSPTPDNDVEVQSAHPLIFRDGGDDGFDLLTISRTGGNSSDFNLRLESNSGGPIISMHNIVSSGTTNMDETGILANLAGISPFEITGGPSSTVNQDGTGISISGGVGGPSDNSLAGGIGGGVIISAGPGGPQSGSQPGGAGGSFIVTGGAGSSGGAGGAVNITTGAGNGVGNSGNLVLNVGAPGGSGNPGSIIVGNTTSWPELLLRGRSALSYNGTAGHSPLVIQRNPASSNGGSGINVQMGSNATGDGILVTNIGTGRGLDINNTNVASGVGARISMAASSTASAIELRPQNGVGADIITPSNRTAIRVQGATTAMVVGQDGTDYHLRTAAGGGNTSGIEMSTGQSTTGSAGSIVMSVGPSLDGPGGQVFIEAGDSSNNFGGSINIIAGFGTGTGSQGGNVQINPGTGDVSHGNVSIMDDPSLVGSFLNLGNGTAWPTILGYGRSIFRFDSVSASDAFTIIKNPGSSSFGHTLKIESGSNTEEASVFIENAGVGEGLVLDVTSPFNMRFIGANTDLTFANSASDHFIITNENLSGDSAGIFLISGSASGIAGNVLLEAGTGGTDGDIYFTSRGGSIRVHEPGQQFLDSSYTADSVVGAFNEISDWTPEANLVSAGMDDFDYGAVIFGDIWDTAITSTGGVSIVPTTDNGGTGYVVLSAEEPVGSAARITRHQGPACFSVTNPTVEFRFFPPELGEANYHVGMASTSLNTGVFLSAAWNGVDYDYSFVMYDPIDTDIEGVTMPARSVDQAYVVQIRHVENGAELWVGVQDGPLSLEAIGNYVISNSTPRFPFASIANIADEIPGAETRELAIDYVRWIVDRFASP